MVRNLELPHIEQIWHEHRSRPDFVILAIGREESAEKLAAFKAEHGYTFPIASDLDRAIYSRFAKEFIPRTYVIDPAGTIRFASVGFSEDRLAELQAELLALLDAKKA